MDDTDYGHLIFLEEMALSLLQANYNNEIVSLQEVYYPVRWFGVKSWFSPDIFVFLGLRLLLQ